MTRASTPRRRLLVTGSTGVLGAAFKTVQQEYPGYTFLFATRSDVDLTDPAATTAYFRDQAVDDVIHLAAISGGIQLTSRYPAQILRENVLMTLNVMEAARATGVGRLVMTLSNGMYPADRDAFYSEDRIHDGPPHDSNYSYAFAKRLIEPAIRAYRTQYAMRVIGLVPSGIFGEDDNYNAHDATWIAGLISRFCEAADSGGDVVIWGDGSPVRELTYAPEMARAYMWCLENHDSARILNIGSSQAYSIAEVAQMIADILGIDRARLRFDVSKARGVDRRVCDNGAFIGLSGFRFGDLRSGLTKTLDWYRARLADAPAEIRKQPRMRAEDG
ncbi:MAG: NAD-dependent epimerase/dehydratase family protein [Alphaproteobacteria bacterium]|nr:NAD-dependent epimerase/dehydratase family protein [Alphaproteobacteria bacterium]